MAHAGIRYCAHTQAHTSDGACAANHNHFHGRCHRALPPKQGEFQLAKTNNCHYPKSQMPKRATEHQRQPLTRIIAIRKYGQALDRSKRHVTVRRSRAWDVKWMPMCRQATKERDLMWTDYVQTKRSMAQTPSSFERRAVERKLAHLLPSKVFLGALLLGIPDITSSGSNRLFQIRFSSLYFLPIPFLV